MRDSDVLLLLDGDGPAHPGGRRAVHGTVIRVRSGGGEGGLECPAALEPRSSSAAAVEDDAVIGAELPAVAVARARIPRPGHGRSGGNGGGRGGERVVLDGDVRAGRAPGAARAAGSTA